MSLIKNRQIDAKKIAEHAVASGREPGDGLRPDGRGGDRGTRVCTVTVAAGVDVVGSTANQNPSRHRNFRCQHI